MNFYQRVDEVVGWAADGEALCDDCASHTWHKAHDNEEQPIFAGTEVTEHDLICDNCGEVIIEAVRYDYSVYMEGTASYTFQITATNIESALAQARSAEDEDGDLLDENDLETHEGEPTLVYERGSKGPVWTATKDENEALVAAFRTINGALDDRYSGPGGSAADEAYSLFDRLRAIFEISAKEMFPED